MTKKVRACAQSRLMPSIQIMRAARSVTHRTQNALDQFVWGSSGLEQETLQCDTERQTSYSQESKAIIFLITTKPSPNEVQEAYS